MTIRWRGELAIDGGFVDDDHKHLIGIINRFDEESAGDDDRVALVHTLADLKRYAREHFRREEWLMREVHFPPPRRAEHESQHRQLVDKLERLIVHFERSLNEDDFQEVVWETADLLKHWLLDHIVRTDLQLKPYARRFRSRPPPHLHAP